MTATNINTKAYTDMKQAHQKAFDDFANEFCFFAFSAEQYHEGKEKFASTTGKNDYPVSMGGGCYVMRSKSHDLAELFKAQKEALREAMNDSDFARGAFYYEMVNHEYHINWQADWDVCDCFGNPEYDEDKDYSDYLTEMGYGEETIKVYSEARRAFYKMAEECGWF